MYIWLFFLICLSSLPYLQTQYTTEDPQSMKCPTHWIKFQTSCYRFNKSPLRSRNDARRNCQAYEADLVSISSLEEHSFLIFTLLWTDPQHRKWYIGARQQSTGYWVNDGDGKSLNELDAAFINDPDYIPGKDYLIYRFSNELRRWGFERVNGEEPALYICEADVAQLNYLVQDDRTFHYGVEVVDPEKVPQGPFFVKEPVNVVFDTSKKDLSKFVTLRCIAGGYPTPTYKWFKEVYESDQLKAVEIDPLTNSRMTVSGGSLIIYEPKQVEDRGSYHCVASNKFGIIVSESVSLLFAAIGDFNLKRTAESGSVNFGKAIFCDPPQFYPGVNYYWARDYFPNFVEEDKRVFVSSDGALYFSSLEKIDEGNYSCNVQSQVSDTGRNGPFFPLRIESHSNFQQLKFPNNFPKAFPEALIAGNDVRLECVVFGYPVPSYNWTRVNSHLPRNAKSSNFNRVLTIKNIQVEDQGEYVCRAHNNRASIQNSVILTIQAEPNFTIPLSDKHMDKQSTLTMTCEAFGIPDVSYEWLRNGVKIEVDRLPVEDRDRYMIADNLLTIRYLNPDRDQAMYQCKATNVLKSRYSSAQLRILSLRPSFKKRPLEIKQFAAEGGNVTIICNPEAAPKPTFTWKKDENTIGGGGRRRILENGNLIISPVSRDDNGNYTCIAKNEYGVDESSGTLIVLRGPSLLQEFPRRTIKSVGQDVLFHCQADIDPKLDIAYIWFHNGMRITDDVFDNVFPEGQYLRITNVTYTSAGDYECLIKTSVGRVQTKTNLVLRGPPGPPGGVQITEISRNSAVIMWTDGAINRDPITHYTISGRTQYNQSWTVLARDIPLGETIIENRYNGRKKASLNGTMTPYSTYEFIVQASNMLGLGFPSAPSPKYNTDSDKPHKAPEWVGGGGGKIGDLLISWKILEPKDQNGPGMFYKIFWRRHGMLNKEFQSMVVQEWKEENGYGIAVVKVPIDEYYQKYDVKIQAGNSDGFGPISNISIVYSAEDMPQVAPQQVVAVMFNSTALNVSWTPIQLTREKIRGKLIGHRLKYWKDGTKEEDAVYYLSRSTKPHALIVGLQPDTTYNVEVMAYNSAGEGPESILAIERTYKKAPQKPPSSVFVKPVNPTTIHVVFRYVQPSSQEEPLSGYKIRVWDIDKDLSQANDTIILVGSKLEAYVTNLHPGKTYHLRVLAFSNGGDGRMSSPAYTFQMGDTTDVLRSSSQHFIPLLIPNLFLLLALLLIY